jgi:hypothetical protein
MATYLRFGALALIKKHAGEFKAGYALLDEVDFLVILDLPNTQSAVQASVGLSRLLDPNFRTARAVGIDEFDKLAAT